AALHVTEEVPAKARLELADTGPVPAHAPRRVLLRALAQEPKLEERRLLLGERLHEAHDQRVHFEVFDALVRRAALVLADNGALREHPALERRQLLRRRIAHERLADRDLPPARREIGDHRVSRDREEIVLVGPDAVVRGARLHAERAAKRLLNDVLEVMLF